MADLLQIFEDALEAEGLANFKVMHTQEEFADVLHVRKTINGTPLSFRKSITFREQESWGNHKRTHIASIAANVAQQFDATVKERREWGAKAVDLNTEDDSAVCLRCGAEANLSDLRTGSMHMAESSVPQPVMNSYDNLPRVKKRFALLALLRDSCESHCSNSPFGGDIAHRKT